MKNYFLKFVERILAKFARVVIARHNPYVIAITGSVGKSSTKEAVYQVLRDRFGEDVRCNHANFNNELGLPLTVLGYGEGKRPTSLGWIPFLVAAYFRTKAVKYPKYLILEMGIDKPGDIKYLCSIARPDLAIITSVEGAHLANFKNIEEYQNEKIGIANELKEGGKLIVNFDEKRLQEVSFEKKYSYSLSDKKADFYAQDVKSTKSGTEYRICSTGQKIAVSSKLIGFQFVYSSLAAFAVGHTFGLQSLEIKKSLEKINPLPGRMRLISGKNDVTIIDDTYNANPSSIKAALKVLSEFDHDGRKVAIIGNMNELGRVEKEEHISVAEYAHDKADLLVFAGPNAELMAKTSSDMDKILWYKNRLELEGDLDKIIQSGDLVLIKASQNRNFFEEITRKLMSEPEKADKLLVRQSRRWQKVKNKF